MNFVFYLNTKDPTEFLGHESIVLGFLEEGEVSWCPIHKCKSMQQLKDAEGGGEVEINANDVAASLRKNCEKLVEFKERFDALQPLREQWGNKLLDKIKQAVLLQ